jgi:molybdopterin/thiamine biosynthesis adenylyltransferase
MFLRNLRIDMQLDNVLVVGLGGLGLPVAKYVKEKGFGYYANIEAIDKVE